MQPKVIKLGNEDNVATLTEQIEVNQTCAIVFQGEEEQLSAVSEIPFGHKIALHNIAKGWEIKKYNEVIGVASQDIQQGAHVHTHNLESIRGRGDIRS